MSTGVASGCSKSPKPARCCSVYPRTLYPTRGHLLPNRRPGGSTTRGECTLLAVRTLPVVEPLPIVVASGLIGDPDLERGPLVKRVIVLVVLAVIPVVPLVCVLPSGVFHL